MHNIAFLSTCLVAQHSTKSILIHMFRWTAQYS